MAIALYYGSSTGNTREVAQTIAKELDVEVDLIDLGSEDFSGIDNYDTLIFGCSTWGEGDLQDDWEENWSGFENLDLSGKTIALFGLGDQESYCDVFVNALGTIYQQVKKNSAKKIVGFTDTSEYDFTDSTAVVDGQFVGLVIDEDNQSELTKQRIQSWCKAIKEQI